jgi:hypothetical protein
LEKADIRFGNRHHLDDADQSKYSKATQHAGRCHGRALPPEPQWPSSSQAVAAMLRIEK